MQSENSKRLWITWENHRRSTEIATHLNAPIAVFESDLPYPLRVTRQFIQTVISLIINRPKLLFVQNPSILLAFTACILKPLMGYRLVVDRHSNFIFRARKISKITRNVFDALSRFTLRQANLTIVTNEQLAEVVRTYGGKAFVLPDPIPDNQLTNNPDGQITDEITLSTSQYNFVMVSTYEADEPLTEVIAAAHLLGKNFVFFITGKRSKCPATILSSLPENVFLTDYLNRDDYLRLLASSDGILALTKNPDTLVCGAYEALSVEKPFILSDHLALRDYFEYGCIFTDNSAENLALKVENLISSKETLTKQIRLGTPLMRTRWKIDFGELRKILIQLVN